MIDLFLNLIVALCTIHLLDRQHLKCVDVSKPSDFLCTFIAHPDILLTHYPKTQLIK